MSSREETAAAGARYHQLVRQLRRQIEDGTLAVGAQIPTEVELAQTHQISRGTVRQALSVLLNAGLIERVQGRGTFVRPLAGQRQTGQRIGILLNRAGAQLDFDILIGAEEAARARGYQITFAYTEERRDQFAADLRRLQADGVAGVLVCPANDMLGAPVLAQLAADGLPCVLADRYWLDAETDYVAADNVGGGYRATEHLLILGHTRIGFVHTNLGTLLTSSVRDRWLGYRQALAAYGIADDPALVACLPQTGASDAPRAYDEYIAQAGRPGAIFAVHDGVALALLQAARRRHVRIPEDLALVGFDDLSYAAHLNPPLTTVAQPRIELGLRAGHLLINRIEGLSGAAQQIALPTHLIVRESCGARLRVQQLAQPIAS